MKKSILLLAAAVLGVALLSLGGVAGSWLDRMLFDDEVRLSEAFGHLAQGDMDAHEKALKEYVLAGGGSKPLRSLALYNLGNCALARAQGGDPVAAKDAMFYFKEALRNDPLLYPAKFNLEILTRSGEEEKKAGGSSESGPKERTDEKDEEEETRESLVFPPPFLGSSP